MRGPVQAVVIISCLSFTALFVGALLVRNSNGPTARKLTTVLLCICVEIILSTAALWFLGNEPVWVALRIGGRIIEFAGVVWFLGWLFKK